MTDFESESSNDQAIDPMSLFSPKINKAVEGLMFLGEITDTVEFCGHSFGLRTLKPQHKYAISRVLQPYRNTIYEADIFQHLHVATALTHVDGKYDFCNPIGPNIEQFVQGRMNYIADVQKGWYGPTLDFLWEQYQILETTAAIAIAELHSLSQGNRETTSAPLPDSSNVPASLEDVMSLGFQPFMISNEN